MAVVLALLAFVVTMISLSPAAWAVKKDGRDRANRAGGDSDGITGNRYQDYEYTIDLPGGGGAGGTSATGSQPSGGESNEGNRFLVLWLNKLLWVLRR
jgi:hypothetical protein